MPTLVINPGTVLRESAGVIRCCLAVVVYDRSGRRIGLSADHVLQTFADGLIYVDDGPPVGRYLKTEDLASLKQHNDGDGTPPFWSAIGAFEIFEARDEQHISIAHGTLKIPIETIALSNSTVSMLDHRSRSMVPGEIVLVGGGLLFEDQFKNTEERYHDFVLVEFPTAHQFEQTDAGALVTQGKNVLGVVISGEGKCFYVAPLGGYLKYHGWSADQRTAAIFEAPPYEHLPKSSADTDNQLITMQRQLRSTPSQFAEGSEEIPEHLLAIYEEQVA